LISLTPIRTPNPAPQPQPQQVGSSLVLESCDISSRSGVGVGVEGATLQLLDSTVHDCERHGVAAYGGFEGAPGRCLVMGCRIRDNKLSGVFVRDGGNAVLRDNAVANNGEFGVALQVRACVGWVGVCGVA